jgi:hypothetical protein
MSGISAAIGINDALRTFGVRVTTQPITPEAVLAALAKI